MTVDPLTDIVLAVERTFPDHSAEALAMFTDANPSYRGASWADVLAVLIDSDDLLEIREPAIDFIDLPEPRTPDDIYIGTRIAAVLITAFYAGVQRGRT